MSNKKLTSANITITILISIFSLMYFLWQGARNTAVVTSAQGTLTNNSKAIISTESLVEKVEAPISITSSQEDQNKVPKDYIELPEDLKLQLETPTSELPEDFKKQLEGPPPELPPDLKAQLESPPPELPEDIKRAMETPPRIVSIDEVNNLSPSN